MISSPAAATLRSDTLASNNFSAMKQAAFHCLTRSSSFIDNRLFFGSPLFWYFLFRLSVADIMVPFAGEFVWLGSPMGCLYSFFGVMSLLLLSHILLLDQTNRGALLRLAVLLPTLYLLADLLFNRRYTLGTPFRDTAWGVFSWHLLAKALDVGLVYTLEGKPPPRWCVPDWADKEAAAQNGYTNGKANGKAVGKQLAFWQRTPIPCRPKWAIASDHLPLQWRLLPLPTRFIDQVVWAIDVFTLRRHGTSFLYVNEMRALEWSQKRLEVAAQALQKGSRSSLKKLRHPHIFPFGYTEPPLIDALLQFSAVVLAIRYFSRLDIPSTTPFYNLPLMTQLITSSAVGIVITLASDLPEHIAFAILQRWPFYIPCTAITPYFRNVARSKTLTDMWGVRWHSFSRRDFVRLNALIPIAPNNRALNVLKSFFWSAVFHCEYLKHRIEVPFRQC